MRLKLIRNGNKNSSPQSKPDGEALIKRFMKWKENKKKGQENSTRKPAERSTFTSNEITPVNESTVADVETNIIEVAPAVNNFTKLLIGKKVLKLHGLDPKQILAQRLRNTGNGKFFRLREKVEKLVKSFKEACDVNECITVEFDFLVNWFKRKLFGDIEFDVVNTMAVSSHILSKPGFENPMELQNGMIEAYDAELEELTGVGDNLDVTREADNIRLKYLLEKKLKYIPVEIFGKDNNLKEEFDDLILKHVAAFGDDLFPTQLSLVKPIICSLTERESVGVFNTIALGIEKKRIQEEKRGPDDKKQYS
eukprot:augustus_masked-scaffold_1-processed-gene-0.4-mRNA-1 protein AED:1.00 eAED:1.00 QI:0/0/0/0/1/1/3/0/308